MRHFYLDNMRAILMVMGLVLHTCAAFSPKGYWIVTYIEVLPWVDAVNDFIHIFRMPLFFMISGFFAHILLEKQTIQRFIYTKFKRIAIPFFSVLLLVNLPQYWFIESLSTSPNDLKVQNHDVRAHLWFLVNLLFYFVVYVAIHKAVLVCIGFGKSLNNTFIISALIMCTPIIYLFILSLNKVGIPIYERVPVIGSVFSLLAYIDYFLLGACVACIGHTSFISYLKTRFGFAFILTLALLCLLPIFFTDFNPPVIIDYIKHLQAIVLSLLVWRAGEYCLASNSKSFRQFSDASYSIYLFHHAAIVAIIVGFNVLYKEFDWLVNPNLLFIFVVLISLIFTVALHQVVIKPFSMMSFVFNGKDRLK